MSLRYEAWTVPWDSGGLKRKIAKIHEIQGSGSGKVSFLGSTGDGQVNVSVAKLEEAGRTLSEIISATTSSLIRVYDCQPDGTNTIVDEWIAERIERVHSDDDRIVKISGPILAEKAFDGTTVYPSDYPTAVINAALQDHIWGGNQVLTNPGFEDPTETPNVWEIWHDATGGDFTISDGTDTTSALAFDITAALMETRLEADIASITDVHVTGDGSEDDPWTIEWVDPINDTFLDNITLTANFTGLTGETESHITETVVGRLVPSGWTKSQTVSRGVIQIFGGYDNFQMVVTTVDTGTYALLVNPRTVPPRFAGAQQVVNVEPGLTYQASIRINPVSGTDTYRFVIRDVNGGFIASDSGGLGSSTYSAGVWSTVTITDIVIPAGVDQIIFRFSNTNASGNPSGFRLDNASLTEGLSATTWGDIIQILMDDAAVDHASDARGPVLDWIDYTGFDDVNDASSVAWARNESYTARFGQTYGQVFDNGVDLGYEWRLIPKAVPSGGLTHDLDWYNTDNLDGAPATAINVKQAVTGGQVTRRIPKFTSVIVEGAEGEYVEAVDATAETDFGHLEKHDLAGQLSSIVSITARKDQLFAAEAANRTAVQFTIIETPDHPRPLVSYVPGDTLPMQLPPDLVKVTRRVQEIAYVNSFPTQYTVTGSRILTGEAAAYDLLTRLWRKFDKPVIQRRSGAAAAQSGDGGMATVMIAAADSSATDIERADVFANGTNDELAFDQAVALLPASGGEIVVAEGTYNVGGLIDFGTGRTKIRGLGYPTFNITLFAGNLLRFGAGSIATVEGLRFTSNTGTEAFQCISTHGDAIWLTVKDCIFDTMEGRACIHPQMADEDGGFLITGNLFVDINLTSGGGFSPQAVIWSDDSGVTDRWGLITGNRIEGVTYSHAAGLVVKFNAGADNVLVTGNTLTNMGGITKIGSGHWFHNSIDLIYEAGDHTGIDHGTLAGLTDDDHSLYSKADGTRAFTGVVAGITPVGDTDLATKAFVDTHVPAVHAARHFDGGADELDGDDLASGAAVVGAVLSADGSGGGAWVADGYRFGERVIYTADATWTKADYTNVRAIYIRLVGAGGGGGGAGATISNQVAGGGGGGGGGYAEALILVGALGATETVTVGEGGAASGASSSPGGNGEASSFGAHCVAGAGLGGTGSAGESAPNKSAAGGEGGAGTTGDLLIDGGRGVINTVVLARATPSLGGTSMFSTPEGENRQSTGIGGGVGNLYGGGGSAASNTASTSARAGGAGADGLVLVDILY